MLEPEYSENDLDDEGTEEDIEQDIELETEDETDEQGVSWMWIILGTIVIIAIVGGLVYAAKNRRK